MNLYQLARRVNNIQKLSNPKKAPRRIKNIILGRMLAHLGFWRIWR